MTKLNWRVALCAVVFCGCENLNIPIDLESDTATLDVDEAIATAEADLCADETSEHCVILKALDESDGTLESPPKLPDAIPTTLEIDLDNDPATPPETKDIKVWLDESGLMDAIHAKRAIGADLSDRLAASAESVQDVSFDTVTFNWQQNSLSFNTVDLKFFVGQDIEPDENGNYDAKALIADGSLTEAGIIKAQDAGATGETDVEFTPEGKALLNDAFKSLKFVVAVSIPDDAEITLNEDEDGNLIKPTGKASVSLKSTVTFSIATQAPGQTGSGSDAAEDAEDPEE